jgi:uncharacterized protein YbjT (DUF2867 family)
VETNPDDGQECEKMKIAVAGATGRVGHHVFDILTASDHDVVPISRAYGVDIISGAGLAAALAGVDGVIDVSTGPSPDQQEATEFFATATRNLLKEGEQAGVRRIVVVSIIGVDRLTGGYNAAKVVHEQAMRSGPIPASILRASQFHEFVGQLVEWGTQGDVSYLPNARFQPVAARTVAQALVDRATDPDWIPAPDNAPVAEIAGPREESLIDTAKLLVARRALPLRIEALSNPAWTDQDTELMEAGALLPSPHATLAGPTFQDWLDATSADRLRGV